MYVIYKVVSGFTYYLRISRDHRGLHKEWTGLINNATKYEDKNEAIVKAGSLGLFPEQIKKI